MVGDFRCIRQASLRDCHRLYIDGFAAESQLAAVARPKWCKRVQKFLVTGNVHIIRAHSPRDVLDFI